jgi:hypothetical protein
VESRLLGTVEVVVDGTAVQLGGNRRVRAVLAALLLHANRTVTVDRMSRGVWREPPPSAEANLRTYVAGLRSAILAAGEPEPRVMTDAGGYRIVVQPGELDLARFDQLVADADKAAGHDPDGVESLLRQAIELWRGDALAGLQVGPQLDAEVARLEVVPLAAGRAPRRQQSLLLAVAQRPLTYAQG